MNLRLAIPFIIFFICLTGINSVAKDIAAQRGVSASNTFYSDKNPTIMIKIDPILTFSRKEDEVISETKSSPRLKFQTYIFWGSKQKFTINITEILDDSFRFDGSINYNRKEGLIKLDKEELIGGIYDTGLFFKKSKGTIHHLVKSFGFVLNRKVIFEISYDEWFHEDILSLKNLTIEQQEYLDEFNKRADKSFQLIEYDNKILLAERPKNRGPYYVEVPSDVRTKPDHKGNYVTQIKPGTEVDVLGKKGRFLLIRTSNGLEGYIYKDYVYALDKHKNQIEVDVPDQKTILDVSSTFSPEEIKRLPGRISKKHIK